jgi:hypothetical protein
MTRRRGLEAALGAYAILLSDHPDVFSSIVGVPGEEALAEVERRVLSRVR